MRAATEVSSSPFSLHHSWHPYPVSIIHLRIKSPDSIINCLFFSINLSTPQHHHITTASNPMSCCLLQYDQTPASSSYCLHIIIWSSSLPLPYFIPSHHYLLHTDDLHRWHRQIREVTSCIQLLGQAMDKGKKRRVRGELKAEVQRGEHSVDFSCRFSWKKLNSIGLVSTCHHLLFVFLFAFLFLFLFPLLLPLFFES